MKTLRWLLVGTMMVVSVAASSFSVHAQTAPPWLQVWLIRGDNYGDQAVLEYRDAAGTVAASFTLDLTRFGILNQSAGRIGSTSMDSILVFDPMTGQVAAYGATGLLPSTEADHYLISGGVPSPDGKSYAYTVTVQHTDQSLPASSWIYTRSLDQTSERLLMQIDSDPYVTVQPVGWSSDGQWLLLANQPVGIGGYILFWTWPSVSLYNLTTGTLIPAGDMDGYSHDGQQIAVLERLDAGGFSSLHVTNLSTGNVMTYPVPNVGEIPQQGGGVKFSPSGTQVAYQVARGDPDGEQFWTIVVDLITGEARIVLTDQATGYDLNFGPVAGWLDESTLVVGAWSRQSAVLDLTAGTQHVVQGEFLGYAVGVTSPSDFASSTAAATQCPGAPISRLQVGGRGRVTFTDGRPVNVRQTPEGSQLGTQPEGAAFTVLNGPICQGNYAWWHVQFDAGVTGYVAEGELKSYYLEPYP